ncbi:ABC transporter ATP-binding protein [Bacillus sp. JCM 19041]|uniref:ABC transporter ATP-binding protein n=1 Tax=Bacillus sp. JCM 19041 TaxID=1460637 RepID=UPI0006D171D8
MLTVKQISKSYENKQVLKNVSLSIPSGTCYGLIGPNGSGKSTLMKIISEIVVSDSGNLFYDTKKKASLGYVPQDISLEETISASANLRFFGKIHNLDKNTLHKRENLVLEQIGLKDRSKDTVNTFSGGMKRRLNIGCALMHNPDLIIMDEPTVGVDPQSRKSIFSIVDQLKNQGKTVIYVSHYMEEIEKLCDYVAFIDEGNIVEAGDIINILDQHAEPSVYIEGANLPEELFTLSNTNKKQHGNGWLLGTNNSLKTLATLATHCNQQNIYPTHLALSRPKLEDVFFSLTGTTLRDDK